MAPKLSVEVELNFLEDHPPHTRSLQALGRIDSGTQGSKGLKPRKRSPCFGGHAEESQTSYNLHPMATGLFKAQTERSGWLRNHVPISFTEL